MAWTALVLALGLCAGCPDGGSHPADGDGGDVIDAGPDGADPGGDDGGEVTDGSDPGPGDDGDAWDGGDPDEDGGDPGEDGGDPSDDGGGDPDGGDPGDQDVDCATDGPQDVLLRDAQQSFNGRYYAWLCGGDVYLKPNTLATGQTGPWQAIDLPDGLDGRASWLVMDDEYLEAANEDREIWLTWNALDDVDAFTWSRHRGFPFGTGDPNDLEPGFLAWTLSATTPGRDDHYTDPAGWPRSVGDSNCTHLFLLKQGGQYIGFNDGWLPADWNHEMCSPLRGRLQAVNLASSGSRHMLITRYGDIFTRLFDYDLSGANNWFEDYFDYTYADQRGIPDDDQRLFQLPPWPWFAQPKIPGRITDRISLHKVDPGVIHGIMRVEGWDYQGRTGYWEKDMHDVVADPVATAWTFVPTDLPIRGTELDNRPEPSAELTLGPAEDACYCWNLDAVGGLPDDLAGDITTDDWAAELIGLHPYCSPAVLRVHVGTGAQARHYDLVLHTTETVRENAIAGRGLGPDPRPRKGCLEVPANLMGQLDDPQVVHPVMRKFVDIYSNDERFYFVDVQASADQVHIEMWDWLWGIDWTFPRCDCQDPRITLRDDADPINDLAGDAHGLLFEDLFLDDQAAQIVPGHESRRNIHTLGDLKSKGW